jgi:hypothetical protein
MSDDVILQGVHQHGESWRADVLFRGKMYVLAFRSDKAGELRFAGRSPLALTKEGREVGSLVDRIRKGEDLALPYIVDTRDEGPRLPSVHGEDWVDWSETPVSINEVWLESVERTGSGFVAQLRLDGIAYTYELEILPGPVLREVRAPQVPSFYSYTYDLTRLLLRMQNGERFALPFKLRPRWPTPPDPRPIEEQRSDL